MVSKERTRQSPEKLKEHFYKNLAKVSPKNNKKPSGKAKPGTQLARCRGIAALIRNETSTKTFGGALSDEEVDEDEEEEDGSRAFTNEAKKCFSASLGNLILAYIFFSSFSTINLRIFLMYSDAVEGIIPNIRHKKCFNFIVDLT
jgi:hypothetical protein